MVTSALRRTSTCVACAVLLVFFMTPGLSSAASDKQKPVKKSAAGQKFRTADAVAKTQACEGVAPEITKLVPDEGKPGTKVTIKGMQFGSASCLRGVSFGPGHAAAFAAQNESTITATVPNSSRKGLVILTVTTASGEDSKPFLIK